MLANLRKAVWRSASHRTPKDSLLDAKTCVRPRLRRIGESRKSWTEAGRRRRWCTRSPPFVYGGPKWPPCNYCFARREDEFPQLVTLFGRAILSEHFSCFGN